MPVPPILRVAVPSPLQRSFDYLPPRGCDHHAMAPGTRVRVPFGRTTRIGVLLEVAGDSRVERGRLRAALEILDQEPLLPPDTLGLIQWASGYYHHPPGECLLSALPALLRRGHAPQARGTRRWRLTPAGHAVALDSLARAPRQGELLRALRGQSNGLTGAELHALGGHWQPAMRALADKGWVECREMPCHGEPDPLPPEPAPQLNAAQRAAVDAVCGVLLRFQPLLLDGVTGSGKTEVYLHIIAEVIAAGRQALVLVPEIGLTPQLVARFRRRLRVPVAVLHSGLSDQERLCAWLMARDGSAPVVIGTRSAVFVPLRNPGLIVIDEEHDLSFKQQDGFRYHARDVAVVRAQRAAIPVLLGSATPSLESLHNVDQGRYRHITLPERAGNARHPSFRIVDLRRQAVEDGLSRPLIDAVRGCLDDKQQVVLFLNRRGYAPTLLCHECGWLAQCARCDARLTLYQHSRRLRCHHCGAEGLVHPQCPTCGSADLRALGQGTERVEQALRRHFPGAGIARIDRDTTRRKGAMEALLEGINDGRSEILIGTQMLAKGHDFPNVTLVGILDADQGLAGVDFRASEHLAQLIVQVAGRAGRADKPGRVLIQTHQPEHPLLRSLIDRGYARFAQAALEERRQAALPPFSAMALLRAEAAARAQPLDFLAGARTAAQALDPDKVLLLGPVPAPMERRAGRYRAQLLLQAERRADLHALLRAWLPAIEKLKLARKVRWSLDVDPVEMY